MTRADLAHEYSQEQSILIRMAMGIKLSAEYFDSIYFTQFCKYFAPLRIFTKRTTLLHYVSHSTPEHVPAAKGMQVCRE